MTAYVVDHCDDLNRTDHGNREVELLEKLTKRTRERSVASTNQSVKEAFEENDEHKSFSTCQNDSCKDIIQINPQIVKNRLVDGEVNDDARKSMQENQQSPKLVTSILLGLVLIVILYSLFFFFKFP